jgi:hypothetical protein
VLGTARRPAPRKSHNNRRRAGWDIEPSILHMARQPGRCALSLEIGVIAWLIKPLIGHLLDTDAVLSPKPLISLARPTGIEPVFPP